MTATDMTGKIGDLFTVDMVDFVALDALEIAMIDSATPLDEAVANGAARAKGLFESAEPGKLVQSAIEGRIADIDTVELEVNLELASGERGLESLDSIKNMLAVRSVVSFAVCHIFMVARKN